MENVKQTAKRQTAGTLVDNNVNEIMMLVPLGLMITDGAV